MTLARPGSPRLYAVAAFVLSFLACSGGEPTGSASRAAVNAVAVTPSSGTLTVGAALQLSATAYDASGGEIPGRQVFWASTDTSIAAVSDAGTVTARKLGTVQIQGAIDGKSAFSFITVGVPDVASVAVAPGTASVAAGATVALQAVVKDARGAALADRFVLWTSSDDNVARVTSTGLVSGVVPGTATISAASGGR